MFYSNNDDLEKVLEGIGTWKMKTDREAEIEKRASKRKKKKFDNGGEMLRLINAVSGFTDGYQSAVLNGGGVTNMVTRIALTSICDSKDRVRKEMSLPRLLKNLGL